MLKKLISNQTRFPIFLLGAAIALNIGVLVWFGSDDYRRDLRLEESIQNYLKVERVRGVIIHLDEVLTMSARMAAFTGDPQWDKRYHRFEPQLNVAIKEAIALAPTAYSKQQARQTDAANLALVEMEEKSFSLVREGKLEEARSLLFSPEYETQKKIYADGMSILNQELEKVIEKDRIREIQNEVFFDIVLPASIVLVLFFGWWVVFQTLRKWKATLVENNQKLADQTRQLNEINVSLDRKVAERTRDLETARQDALGMMSQAQEARDKTQQALSALEREMKKRARLEEHTRQILDTAHDAFIAIDSQGKVVNWNRQAEIMFGWSRNEVMDQLLSETIIPPRYRQAHEQGLKRFLETGKGAVFNKPLELEGLRKDGNEFPIEITIWANAWEKSFYFNAFVRDITEKKNLEERLLQSQKMEAMGRLAGGIAHDFNNLLSVINSYSDMHIAHLPQNDPLRADLEEIYAAGKRAAGLTSQLLAFSRRQVIQTTVISLNDLILNIDKMLRHLIGENIEMVTIPAQNLWNVKIDSGLVEQVILNLVVNARDAMPSKGKLVIETKNITLSEDYVKQHLNVTGGDYVMIAISDTGHGMTPEVKAHLFEPFFTTKPKGKGTGLGLATSYGIIQQLKGHIGVYSEVGKGTTFKIYIPRSEETPLPATEETRLHPQRGTETILLVEDEPLVRQLALKILTSQGYHVLSANNGEEALHLVREKSSDQSIDLLLTDVIMPQMGGKELSQRIQPLYPKIKVLFMSGYTDEMIAHQGILDPGVNFVAKPFLPDTLIHRVREVLDTHS
jgi:PAS domain S-box-containing protein